MSKPPVVAYFFDEHATNHVYTFGHPWRPFRSKMVETLVDGYGLKSQMLVHRPVPRTLEQLTEFHADDYIEFLERITPDNTQEFATQLKRYNMGAPGESDCPVFDGMLDYFALLSGGSVDGAALLANKDAQIAVNWAGGMHHAKKAEASGFCFVNDIVLAVLELLKTYTRVLYVDIDIHHGDGVEEAFYLTDRVMTVSFHRYGDYFPGTGSINDVGYGKGKHYTVNVPLQDGIDDESYRMVYEPIMTKVMEMYQPEAIVVCSGADSLSGDRLGCFNLSLQGHSNCVEFLARYQVPLLVVGGGGYTLRNVARCWTYETGRLMGIDLPDELPLHALKDFNYYMDTERLRIQVSNMRNANRREDLEAIRAQVLENLRDLPPVPSVPMTRAPAPTKVHELPDEDMDVRGGGQAYEDRRVVRPGDESDDEDMAGVGRRAPWEVDRRAAGEQTAGDRFAGGQLGGGRHGGDHYGGQRAAPAADGARGGWGSGYGQANDGAGSRAPANGASGHGFGGASYGGGARTNGAGNAGMQAEGTAAAPMQVDLEADEQLDPAMDDEPMGQQHQHVQPQKQQAQQHKPHATGSGMAADAGNGGGAYRPGVSGLDGAFIQQLAGPMRPQQAAPMPGIAFGSAAGMAGVPARAQQQQQPGSTGSPRATLQAEVRPTQPQLPKGQQQQPQQQGYQYQAMQQPQRQLPSMQQQQQQPAAARAPDNNRTGFNTSS